MCTLSTRLNPFGLDKWEEKRLFLEGIFLPCLWFLYVYNFALNWNQCIWHTWSFQPIPIIKIWSSIPKKCWFLQDDAEQSAQHFITARFASVLSAIYISSYLSQVVAGEEIQEAGICRQTSHEPWRSHSHVVCPGIATMSFTQMLGHSQKQPSGKLIHGFLPFLLGKILFFCKKK